MKERIVSFDALRFIACIFIILHHAGINIYIFHQLPNPFFRTAGLAVEIFFVLSGFLIAKSYYRSLNNGLSSGDKCKKYFYNRIKRLYPEYIFAMCLCAFLTNAFSHPISMDTFMLNAVMMAGWGGIPNIINGIWYVVVLFWGGCLIFNLLVLYREKAKYFILPTITCVCLFYLVNHGHTISGHQQSIEFKLLSKGTIRGILGLTIGLYCFQVCQWIKISDIQIKPMILSKLLLVLEIVAVILLVNAILIRKGQNIDDFNIYFYISYIVGLLYFGKEKLLKFLSWKGMQPLADLSYTIYLTHLILLEILRVHWTALSSIKPFYMYIIVVVLCIMFGYICYHAQKWLFTKLKQMLFVSQDNLLEQHIENTMENSEDGNEAAELDKAEILQR